MADSKVFTALLKLAGRLDGSFSASMKKAVDQLDKVDQTAKKLGNGQHFNKLANSADHQFSHIEHRAETFGERFRGILESVGVFAAGEMLAHGIETGIEKLKEFTVESMNIRAEREVLQNQLHAVLTSQGMSSKYGDIDMMIRKFSDNEAPIKYEPAAEVVSQLLAAAPGKFKTTESLHAKLHQLADLSKDEETFKLASQAYTRVLANGKLDAQHLNELSIDTGFPIRQYLAKALHMSVEQLGEAIKKHKLTGAQGIAGLDKALGLMDAPGGPAFEHAAAQMTGLKGIFNRSRSVSETSPRASERLLKTLFLRFQSES